MLSLIPEMIIVYSIRDGWGGLRIIFTDIRRSLVFPHSKVRKRLTKKIIVSYSGESSSLPYKYLGRIITEETVREVEWKLGYLYSL